MHRSCPSVSPRPLPTSSGELLLTFFSKIFFACMGGRASALENERVRSPSPSFFSFVCHSSSSTCEPNALPPILPPKHMCLDCELSCVRRNSTMFVRRKEILHKTFVRSWTSSTGEKWQNWRASSFSQLLDFPFAPTFTALEFGGGSGNLFLPFSTGNFHLWRNGGTFFYLVWTRNVV